MTVTISTPRQHLAWEQVWKMIDQPREKQELDKASGGAMYKAIENLIDAFRGQPMPQVSTTAAQGLSAPALAPEIHVHLDKGSIQVEVPIKNDVHVPPPEPRAVEIVRDDHGRIIGARSDG